MNNTINQTATRRKIIAAVIAGILLLPVVGMMISDQVNWSVADFVIATILLTAAGLVVDFIFSRLRSRRARIMLLGLLLILFALVWGELAVGLFGTR